MTEQSDARDVNLLGALVVAANDRFVAELARSGNTSVSRAAALTSLRDYPGITIDALATTLGITGSGSTRLVAGLLVDELVTKAPAPDGRAVALHLTRRGRKAADSVHRVRQECFAGMLAALSPRDQITLVRLCELMLPTLGSGQAWEDHSCRFCELPACPQERCPVARAGAAS